MTLALAGLASVAMARAHGALWAGWITIGAASLLAAHPAASGRSGAQGRPRAQADAQILAAAWSRLARREIFGAILIALSGACVAWVMPSWAFDPLVLAVVAGDASPLREAGPFAAPVAETMTVALAAAALLRLEVWPAIGGPADTHDASSDGPDAALDTLAVIRDVSAIALLVRHDAVLALAPVPLAGLGVVAWVGAWVGAGRVWRARACAAAAGAAALDPRPAGAAVALLALASFVPELAVAVVALAGATWWVLRREPADGSRGDALLRWSVAPLPLGLGLAIALVAQATWTHVSAWSPLWNVAAPLACLGVGVSLARAARLERAGAGRVRTRTSGDAVGLEARRAAQLLVAAAILGASPLIVPSWAGEGSALSQAFAAHVAIPRGLTGAYAIGPAQGWGDRASATWAIGLGIVGLLLAATVVLARRREDEPAGHAVGSAGGTGSAGGAGARVLAGLAWLDEAPRQAAAAAAQLVRGIGGALEFAVGRVGLRDFIALASDELDRAAEGDADRRRLRAGLGLLLVLSLVLGAVFANDGAATLTPTSLHGFPGLRARMGVSSDTAPAGSPASAKPAGRDGSGGGR
jgi:hypothetical protein